MSAGIFACPIFCLKQSASAHHSFSQTALPATQHGQDAVGAAAVLCLCRAEAQHREFQVGSGPQGILRVLPPQPPSRQSRSGFSLLSPDRGGGGGRESAAGRNRRNSRDAFVTRLVELTMAFLLPR